MKTILWLTMLSTLALVGCHSSGSNTGGTTQTGLDKLANQAGDSDPGALDDAAGLLNEINTLFGNADDEPVEVESGDTLQDVINRAGS